MKEKYNFNEKFQEGCLRILDKLDQLGNHDGVVSLSEIKKMDVFDDAELNTLAVLLFQKYAKADGDDNLSLEEYVEAIQSEEYSELLKSFYDKKNHAASCDKKVAVSLNEYSDEELDKLMKDPNVMESVVKCLSKRGKKLEDLSLDSLRDIVKKYI